MPIDIVTLINKNPPEGYIGSRGETGYQGSQGDLGYTGSFGDLGYVGSQGTLGYIGSQGDLGYTGSRGDLGYVGSFGDTGYVGSQGDTGYLGSIGPTGYVGSFGDTGYTGSRGDTGYIGSIGPTGYTGSQGTDVGYTGSRGDVGYIGSQGDGGAVTDPFPVPILELTQNDPLNYPIYAWGCNSRGALGDNSSMVSKSSPVSVVGGIINWTQISAGQGHNLALTESGVLWSWGANLCGQLGINGIFDASSPVSVVGGFADWCQISAGGYVSLAVRKNGTLWAWGRNNCGQLGDNTVTNKSSPVSVVGGFTDWYQASAGECHSLAVRTNGTLWAWGSNYCGQLGDGTTTNISSPVSVVGGFTDWCHVGTGGRAAIRQNGTLWTWGRNLFGILGDNTSTDTSSPVSVVGGFTDWCQVSFGGLHMLGLRTNGTIWGWGLNNCGRLGNNNTATTSSPVSVVGGFTDWCQVTAGSGHSLAVRCNGSLWAWGGNSGGYLGDGTTEAKSSPISVIGGFADWYQVSAGSNHIIATRKTLLPT